MPPRAAIVGAGLMGRWHAHAARRLGIDVLAVVDVDSRAAQALASRLGPRTRPFAELDEALRARDVDVVHVCTPAGTHGPLVGVALEAGRHVLVEKPLAASLPETEAMLHAAREAGVRLTAVHQLPFQPGVRRLHELDLGDLVAVDYTTASAGGEGRPAASRTALLREIVPHAASLFQRFAPGFDPRRLDVEAREDELAVAGWHGSTRLAAFVTLRGRPPRNELRVTGTRASGVADLFHGFAVVDSVGGGRRGKVARPFAVSGAVLAAAALNGARRARGREPAYPGLRELIRRFYAAALEGAEPPIADEEILAAAALADACPT
jgi:predicted dehydrogenase